MNGVHSMTTGVFGAFVRCWSWMEVDVAGLRKPRLESVLLAKSLIVFVVCLLDGRSLLLAEHLVDEIFVCKVVCNRPCLLVHSSIHFRLYTPFALNMHRASSTPR